MEFIDPKSAIAQKTLEDVEKLWNTTWEEGGYSRYHLSSEPDSPGPWPFATLFAARAYVEAADYKKVQRILDWIYKVGSEAGVWFEFYGNKKSPPSPPVGIVPWAWAEIIVLVVHHILGVRPCFDRIIVRPRLLLNMARVSAKVPFRKQVISLTICRATAEETPGFYFEDRFQPYREQGFELPIPEGNISIKVILPLTP